MSSFRYTALTAAGERVAGVLAGASEQAVLAEMESRRLTPLTIEPVEQAATVLRRGVGTRVLATALAQLADLLRAGVPLLRALQLLGARKSEPRLSAAFREIGEAVARGTDLGEAMGARPDVFTPVQVAMVRAGERGGFLEPVLARLATLLHAQADLRSKVAGSLVYPGVLVGLGCVVLGVVFGVFIPMFRPIFDKIEVGTLTRAVLGASDILSRYGLWMLAALGAGAVVGWRLSRRPSVRRAWSRFLTVAPVIGPLTRALAIARFCRILGTMLANAVPLLPALQVARDAAGNAMLADAIERAAGAVRDGQRLAVPLGESGLFPLEVVEMIAVGEAANNLDGVLLTVADTLEARVDRLVTSVVRLIEPALLLVIAAVVGVVALALILPMTKISQGVN